MKHTAEIIQANGKAFITYRNRGAYAGKAIVNVTEDGREVTHRLTRDLKALDAKGNRGK